jgi:hypothetical protein
LIDWYRAAGAGIVGAAIGLAVALAGVLFWGVIKLTARIAGTFGAYRIHTRDETLKRLQARATARAERKERFARLREEERQREQAMASR